MSTTAPVLEAGAPQPSGAHWTGNGTNFAVFSAIADRVELCLFDASGHERARLALPSRTGDIWHGFLPAEFGGVGTLYGYRVHGPYHPSAGHRCNPAKLLMDPAALALAGDFAWHPALNGGSPLDDAKPDAADSAAWVPRCRVVDRAFDWGGGRRPHVPWRDTVIYEVHVKGYTQRHPRVPPEHRGKYLGLAHPAVIDHLHRLGVTSIELMPCHAWVSEQSLVQRGLTNYWGYNPFAWFAPDARYGVADPVAEFKIMVRALHAAGLEVILDVVFNHTAEGDQRGPTLSLRGFDNANYYRLPPHDRSQYENFSGTGNTVSFDHPAVRSLVIDCLRYWVSDMGVDGFRFDLAPVLGRDSSGYSSNAPLFAALRSDPVLAYTKLIAEPWDVGPGGYQLGHFPAGWSEWNDRFRDTTRAFWRGDRPLLGTFAERFAGSSDLFRHHGRKPTATVNFVASHDGFTLADIVSYNDRHNEANLENGADGHTHNLSWNHGVEGPTDDPAIAALRRRQMRNFLATVLLAQGVPMLLAGDEMARSQRGNNNTYCQDNELSWIDWDLVEQNYDLVDFARHLIRFRRSRPGLRRDTFLKGARRGASPKDVSWLHPAGRELSAADWNDPGARCLGVLMSVGATTRSAAYGDLLVIFNADEASNEFVLPPPPADASWCVLFDTALRHPGPGARMLRNQRVLPLEPRSTVLLESQVE
ncbi:MAG TPA: glycogen debranching protein GlgX [Steroidobacteraceae bacterium]|nr:glycogen debranching protein GlgX [Steroidobacteraceae bacterium]